MMSKDPKKNTSLSTEEKQALLSSMRHFGYLLPTNDEELEAFEMIYGSTKVLLPQELSDIHAVIGDSSELKDTDKAHTQERQAVLKQIKTGDRKDYFIKIVLAAKITDELYMEPTFGHLKMVKLLYLCEGICQMRLSTKYKKHAAGPLDPKFLYSIDNEFVRQKWFKPIKRRQYGFRYEPLENKEKYKKYYERHFDDADEQIQELIELFRKKRSAFCELVATLYAVWTERMVTNDSINMQSLIESFYTWSSDKKKFTEKELIDCYEWMKSNHIHPSE